MYKEWLLWKRIKRKYRINYSKVVLVLSGENRKLDKVCIDYLDDFVRRKYAKEALIFYPENEYSKDEFGLVKEYRVEAVPLPQKTIDRLYSFYCFMKFFDNIVFTYVDKPTDNQLGRYLRETEVNEVDAACLALYHLRHIPLQESSREQLHV